MSDENTVGMSYVHVNNVKWEAPTPVVEEIERLKQECIDELMGQKTSLDAYYEKRLKAQSSEGGIKDRALVVARGVLEELCAFIWEEHEDKMMKEHILRARDQVMNARLGKLSSDPFPTSDRRKPRYAQDVEIEVEQAKHRDLVHAGHDSDCATHNMPARPNGPCDCSLSAQPGQEQK